MITSHLVCANFFMINLNVIITFMLQLFNNNRETMLHAEAVVQSCSVKKVFLEISQNSQENACSRVSFLIKLQASGLSPTTLLKKRLWHSCFPVNFLKFLRTPFFMDRLWWLLLYMIKPFRPSL